MKVTPPTAREIEHLDGDDKQRDEAEITEHEHDIDQDNERDTRAMQRPSRAAAARCNYIGMVRPDIQYASKDEALRTASPAQHDNWRLERVTKYMIGAAGTMVQLFRWACVTNTDGYDEMQGTRLWYVQK